MTDIKSYTYVSRNFQAPFALMKFYLAYPLFHNSFLMGLVEDVFNGRRSGGENIWSILHFCIERLAWKEK